MAGENGSKKAIVAAPEYSGSDSSLVPMLVCGLVMIVLGMIAVAVFA